MSTPTDKLPPLTVISQKLGDGWLVGFVFENRRPGEDMMIEVAKLLNQLMKLRGCK